MSTKYSDTKIHQFIKSYVKSRDGALTEESDEVFTVTYPGKTDAVEYTYLPALSREKKIPLITPGSPTFQQILKECLEKGVLCQVSFNPKESFEAVAKRYFRDSPFACDDCDKITLGEETFSVCLKSPPCRHKINNGKITSVKVIKKESVRFFQFFYSIVFQNKLRPKNEETLTIIVGEDGSVVRVGELNEDNGISNEEIAIQDFKAKLEAEVFDNLKKVAEEKLGGILKEKLVLFDLQLAKEKKSKLRSFDKRLRKERREKVISRKHDFDVQQWHVNHEALLKREEESFTTNVAVKLVNLLVINTSRVKLELTLDNNSTMHSSLVLGISYPSEVTCPICRKAFSEGYATQDSLYVCKNCVRQSIDTGKFYSKKAALTFDETLHEYFAHDSGFTCAVCGKRHSRLLEFKCSHDNSSVCISHYGLCDVCGKVFSKLNLSYTDEFKRQLCPKHAAKNKGKGAVK